MRKINNPKRGVREFLNEMLTNGKSDRSWVELENYTESNHLQ